MEFEIVKPRYLLEIQRSGDELELAFAAKLAMGFRKFHVEVDGVRVYFRPSAVCSLLLYTWTPSGKPQISVQICAVSKPSVDRARETYINTYCGLSIDKAFDVLSKSMVHVEPYLGELEL